MRASMIVYPLLFAASAVAAADYSTGTSQTTTTNTTTTSVYTTNSAATGVTGAYNNSNAFNSGGASGASTSGTGGVNGTGAYSTSDNRRDRDYRDRGYDRGRDHWDYRGNDRSRATPYTQTERGLAPIGDGIYAGRTVTRSGYESNDSYRRSDYGRSGGYGSSSYRGDGYRTRDSGYGYRGSYRDYSRARD